VGAVNAADCRVAELRARRAARAAERAEFEERRRHGLAARHAAKLAHLAARQAEKERAGQEEELPEDSDNRTAQEPEVA
jgi:hypothetical protein